MRLNAIMSRTPPTDEELSAEFDAVTVWVSAPPGPKEVWSLREAIEWAAAQGATRVTLFRPPDAKRSAAWVNSEQIARLSEMLPKARVRRAG